MNTSGLSDLLPEVLLLSTFPFVFYWFTRPSPTSSEKGFIGFICVVAYLGVCAMYAIFVFGSGMSGGGAGPYPLNRLLQSPLQVLLLAPVLPASAVWLAGKKMGSLGLWAYAIGAGFISFWAGLGWLPAEPVEMDWRFVIAFAVVGGLCGMTAGFVLGRISQQQGRWVKVLVWSAVGASSAAIGMLASGPGVQSAMKRLPYHPPGAIEVTPYAVDPGVMVTLLLIVVAVWLSLSTLAAILTGYIRVGRRLPADIVS